MKRLLLTYFLIFLSSLTLLAQRRIQLIDQNTTSPLPLVLIELEGKKHLTDVNGKFDVDSAFSGTFRIIYPESIHPKIFHVDNIKKDSTIWVQNITTPTPKHVATDSSALSIILRMAENKKQLEPYRLAPFTVDTYNKFTLSSSSNRVTSNTIQKLLSYIGLRMNPLKEKQHLIFSETTTQLRYKSRLKQDEKITGIKISGIDQPVLSTVNSLFNSFSLYEPQLKIASKTYINPINNKADEWYDFNIMDTVRLQEDLLFITFRSKPDSWREPLHGYYYYSLNSNCIVHALYVIDDEKKTKIFVSQSNQKIGDAYFPVKNSTYISVKNISIEKKKVHFLTSMENQYSIPETTQSFTPKFTDIAIKFESTQINNDTAHWENSRPEALNEKEKNTYRYYDSLGTLKNFSSLATVGEKLYSKQIPLNKFTIDLEKSIVLNEYETVRLGIGAFTNRTISEWVSLGFYTGYGFNDNDAKYDLYARLWPKNKYDATLSFHHYKTVEEAAGRKYPFHKDQYSSEWIRSIGVSQMEILQGFKLAFTSKPFSYTRLYAKLDAYQGEPSYEYAYKGELIDKVDYFDYTVGFNFAFGQRYVLLIEKQLPLNSPYPSLWFTYTSSIDGSLNDFFSQGFDLRIDYDVRYLNQGLSKFRFVAGKYWGDLPIYKLYNHSGSQGFLGVTYNSFETMAYNEFLSNDYASLFFTHDFGRLFNVFSWKNFRPHVVLALNVGYGWLSERSNYTGKEFKTLERGYYEIGGLINRLVQINLPMVKTSLGLGYYYRMGPNRLDTFKDNSALKVSFKFSL